MSERPRQSTMMSPPSLPHGFNWGTFVSQLTMLDMKIRDTIKGIDKALNEKNEERMFELRAVKEKQRHALMAFLTKAYDQTQGRIADLPEFDPDNERSFKLALMEEGEDLWESIRERVNKIREGQAQRMMQTLDRKEDD
jgi:hypothetical protein